MTTLTGTVNDYADPRTFVKPLVLFVRGPCIVYFLLGVENIVTQSLSQQTILYINVHIKTKIIIGVVVQDERYKNEPSKEEFPMFESLKLTIDRTLPYWNNVIVPQIK